MIKITLKGFLSFIFLFGIILINAQVNNSPTPIKKNKVKSLNSKIESNTIGFKLTDATKESINLTGFARCLTDENEIALQEKYPERLSSQEFESWLAPKLQEIKASRQSGNYKKVVYNIPVVIHIVHDGDAVGTGENITDTQALSQIQVMNEDFRRLAGTPGGANTTGQAVDLEINFCIAQQDPSGNPTNGVVRHNITPYSNNVADGSGGPDWETRADTETMKAATQWDPTRYLNMWTIRPGGLPLDQGGQQGLLGYAQFPSNSGLSGLNTNGGAANTDGVVAGFDAMGTLAEDDGTFILNPTYNLGRTMTHEVGHWVGLRHIWGDGPQSGSCGVDDFCADTPNAAQPNYTCNPNNSCGGSPTDQIQNYMDYTNDACMDTFTQDQKDRVIAVMTNSPRRMELSSSNVCNVAQPTVNFVTSAPNSIQEGSDCGFQDFTFDLSMTSGGSASSIASFLISGTSTNISDFELLNNSVSFATGSATASGNNTITLRIYNDDFVESDETLTLTMNVSTSGDAIATLNTYTVTILDDDSVPNPSSTINVFSQTFDNTTGFASYDRDGDMNEWYIGVTGLDGFGDITGACAASESNGTLLGTGGAYTPDQYLVTEAFTIPSEANSASVSYAIGSFNNTGSYQEQYSVYFTTISPPTAFSDLEEFLLEDNRVVPATGTEIRTHDLSAYAGSTGQMVIRHHNSAAANGLLILDNLNVTAQTQTTIQTAVNSGSPDQVNLNTSGTAYTTDNATSNIVLDITNTNADDFGCVDTFVSRSGTGAQTYNGSTTANFVTDKTFTIVPTNVLSNTDATVDFYFTNDEITGWEAITGQSRNALSINRDNGSTIETVAATVTAFGSDFRVSGNFISGIDGTYYFGVANTLSTSNYDFEAFTVYPNPTNGNVSISLSTSDAVSISVYDIRGRKILNKKFSNSGSVFNKTIDLNTPSTGVYILKVEAGNRIAFKRIIVK